MRLSASEMMLFKIVILEHLRWEGEEISVWGSQSFFFFKSVKGDGRKCNMSVLTFPTYFCFQEPLYIHAAGCGEL